MSRGLYRRSVSGKWGTGTFSSNLDRISSSPVMVRVAIPARGEAECLLLVVLRCAAPEAELSAKMPAREERCDGVSQGNEHLSSQMNSPACAGGVAPDKRSWWSKLVSVSDSYFVVASDWLLFQRAQISPVSLETFRELGPDKQLRHDQRI